jgi:hypothetical protein
MFVDILEMWHNVTLVWLRAEIAILLLFSIVIVDVRAR